MNLTSIGDLAQNLLLRNRSAEIKSTIATLTQELSTGQTANVSTHLGGDYTYLSEIDRNLSRLSGFAVAASEAAVLAGASQLALEQVHDVASKLGLDLLTSLPSTLQPARSQATEQAKSGLKTVINALNGSAAGRSLFSGTATDRAPLATADTLLSDLKTQVAGLVSASDVLTAIDDWFADAAGFDAVMYTGSDQTLAAIQVGAGEYVNLSLRADNADLKQMIRNTAVAALAADPDLALNADVQNELLHTAGEGFLQSEGSLTSLRADLGYAESRIEQASTRNASARTGLEFARNELLEADPYDTAARLQEVQFQLESLYAVTVRNSRLSLLNFLK
ncbi:MAG: flagellar hook-associated protein 3 FlgL [Paracoccaceae bacterium]|jgi:flagellar hook-associated protein 3 FlgL